MKHQRRKIRMIRHASTGNKSNPKHDRKQTIKKKNYPPKDQQNEDNSSQNSRLSRFALSVH